jgi:hypothetical protein
MAGVSSELVIPSWSYPGSAGCAYENAAGSLTFVLQVGDWNERPRLRREPPGLRLLRDSRPRPGTWTEGCRAGRGEG